MTKNFDVEAMINGKESKFPLVLAVAKRMREIGAEIEENTRKITQKSIIVAYEEFKNLQFDIISEE